MRLTRPRPNLPFLILMILPFVMAGGCGRGGVSEVSGGPSRDELLAYYSPRTVQILPFTKVRSFDDDLIPDGVGVSLKTLDSAGDAVKAYGTFLFELYAYRPAAGDHRGELIQTWEQPVLNNEDLKRFWSRITDTYEFQLSWEGMAIPPQKKYLLTATFQSPGTDRLFDEYAFDFKMDRDDILNAMTHEDAGR